MDELHILFIKKGFKCGIQSYVDHANVRYCYSDEVTVDDINYFDKLIVHSAPHGSHPYEWCRDQIEKVLKSGVDFDILIHERTMGVYTCMTMYDMLVKKAKTVYTHSFEGSLYDHLRSVNPTADYVPLILPYVPSSVSVERTKEAVFVGRNSLAKPSSVAQAYADLHNIDLDVITEYEREEIVGILAEYKYAILPMKVEGSFSLEYTAMEAENAGCILILSRSWERTEAVRNSSATIHYID